MNYWDVRDSGTPWAGCAFSVIQFIEMCRDSQCGTVPEHVWDLIKDAPELAEFKAGVNVECVKGYMGVFEGCHLYTDAYFPNEKKDFKNVPIFFKDKPRD